MKKKRRWHPQTIISGYMKLKSYIHGLIKKIKNELKNLFRLSEIVKQTIKVHSSISKKHMFLFKTNNTNNI